MEGKHAAMWRKGGRKPKNREDHNVLYHQLEKELRGETATNQNTSSPEHATQPESVPPAETKTDSSAQLVLRSGNSLTVPNAQLAKMYPVTKHGRAIVLPDEATAEELQQSTQPVEDQLDLAAWKKDMPEREAENIENLFRTDEEMAQKEAVFNSLNKEYLDQQERKENDRLREEAAAKDKEDDEIAQAEGHARYVKSNRGRKRRRDSGEDGEGAPTTEQALFAAVSSRKISRKINYDAMSAIFDDGGGFSTDVLDQEPTAEHQDDPEFAMM